MVCIYCGEPTAVFNSRVQKRANSIWRRRRCLACGALFTTSEYVTYDQSFVVRTAGSHILPFERDKLYLSLYGACRHRKNAVHDAGALTDTVIRKLLVRHIAVDATIDVADIVVIAYETLRAYDKAAGVSYAAFHPLVRAG